MDEKEDGFDSGEDDDLIVIGKHKGVGSAQSQLQNIENLSGDQIIKEDKYAKEFDKLAKQASSEKSPTLIKTL